MAIKTIPAAVITGDVIASSQLNTSQRKKLQTIIDEFIATFTKLYPDMQFQQYRGDSMQLALTTNKQYALSIALQLESTLVAESFAVRLGIGVGDISFTSKDVITSDGSAFQVSGPLVDELKKKNEWIGIASTDKAFNAEWLVQSASLNFLLQRLSPSQAEALTLHLQNMKQNDIAQALKISQPSVHQRLQAGGAEVFTYIVNRFENTLALL